MGRPDESNDGPVTTPADRAAGDSGSNGTEARAASSWVQRVLDNKTGLQRLVISLGALATALVAIGGVVTAMVRVLADDDNGSGSLQRTPGETQRVESGTATADEFVHDLLDHDGGVVVLDHQVIADKGPADVRLQYDCTNAGVCVMVRLQDVDVVAGDLVDGRWFEGCFAVTQDGVGYGAEPLDIELRHQGAACP